MGELSQVIMFIYLLAYVIVFLSSLIWVKKRGKDPKGTTKPYNKLAELSSLFTCVYLVNLFLYIFWPNIYAFVIPFSFMISDAWSFFGLLIIAIGLILETVGMITLGENFRIAFPREETTLIRHGIYRTIRNPIVLSVFLLVIGSFLVCPNLLTFGSLIGNLITFNAKATDEERFLANRFGSKWDAYAKNAGKYLPRVFKKS